MKYGYARVSTDDQNTALQLAALKKAGCKTIFKDEGLSGATVKIPAASSGAFRRKLSVMLGESVPQTP